MKAQKKPIVFYHAIKDAYIYNRDLAEKAIGQLSDHQLHLVPDEQSNSIAVIMKHISGNLISRWTDCLYTDGEKPDRHRDQEFIDTFKSRNEILNYWEKAWSILLDQLNNLSSEDPNRIIYIRGVEHTLAQALARSLAHTCFHIGQIVLLSRYYAGSDWSTLSIPRGKSDQYNQEHWGADGRSHY